MERDEGDTGFVMSRCRGWARGVLEGRELKLMCWKGG
jgi:hypothetical protein